MVVLRISTGEPLLGAFVGAFVRELFPTAELIFAPAGEWGDAKPGVRVDAASSGRWLFVASGPTPVAAAAAALAAGACAVVTTDSEATDFERAMGALLSEKDTYVPASTVRGLASEIANRSAPLATAEAASGAQDLTARERDVLRLVSLGYSNAEIADELTISSNTVRSHLHALSVKLQATGRMKMLANARALQIPEAFATEAPGDQGSRRVPA
jgi:DNA-binding NarL/FixJ family response regulator